MGTVVLTLALLLSFSNCSKPGNSSINEDDSQSTQTSPGQEKTETGNPPKNEYELYEKKISDIGNVCSGHEYVIDPGYAGTLQFHILLNRDSIDWLGDDDFSQEDLDINQLMNAWGKTGIIHEIESFELEKVESVTPLWGIRHPQLGNKLANNQDIGEKKILEHQLVKGNRTILKIRFKPGGDIGILTHLPRHSNPKEIGAFDYQQISEILGEENMQIKLKNELLIIDKLEAPTIRYYVTLNINVQLPEDFNSKNTGCQNWVQIKGTKILLNLTFDNEKDKKIHISGPWNSPDCPN